MITIMLNLAIETKSMKIAQYELGEKHSQQFTADTRLGERKRINEFNTGTYWQVEEVNIKIDNYWQVKELKWQLTLYKLRITDKHRR